MHIPPPCGAGGSNRRLFSAILCTTMPKLLATLFLILLCACSAPGPDSGCLSCHQGIEHISASHSGCVSCHGGNGTSRDKKIAHAGMFGGRNPASPTGWKQGCGSCHQWQLERVESSLMATNAGLIRNTRLTWESGDQGQFGVNQLAGYAANGKPLTLQSVAELDDLSGELFRKFCVFCHLGIDTSGLTRTPHGSGCSACHLRYNATASYGGNDPSMGNKSPSAELHRLEALPTVNNCMACHNRSGRIALNYQGLYDGNNGLVPTRGGQPGPVQFSGDRNATSIQPDIHAVAGMDCIDCHTSRDVMGDGYLYRNLYDQVETACEDCHGSATRPPLYRAIVRENEDPVRESRAYPLQMRLGQQMILTSKGRPYSNVFHVDGNVLVQVKQTGRLLRSKIITGTPEHTVVGHGRLSCTACHSRTVVQCYGCHTQYDKEGIQMDFIKGEETPGQFTETEDYRTLYPFPLAVNHKGQISPVTPGCQTFVTVVDEQGRLVQEEAVMQYKGERQLRFAPFHGHNIGKKSIGCAQCHSNPTFLGFGQHVVEGRSIKGTLICERSDHKPLDGFLTMNNGQVQAFSAITRERSRPLNQHEVQRALAVNSCLICHASANDPIYRKRINYRDLDDTLHRRLLAPR